MDLSSPPSDIPQLTLWKVFVKTYQGDLWQIVHRWLKRYGNPFYESEGESDVIREKRLLYQAALYYITDPVIVLPV